MYLLSGTEGVVSFLRATVCAREKGGACCLLFSVAVEGA